MKFILSGVLILAGGLASHADTVPAVSNSMAMGAVQQAAKKIEAVAGVDLDPHLVPGKVTIAYFYADWCAPCHALGPYLEDLVTKDANVYLRKINKDQNEKLAAAMGVRTLPVMIVYDKSGKILATIQGDNRDRLTHALATAKGPNTH